MQQLYTTIRRYSWLQSIVSLALGAFLLLMPNLVVTGAIYIVAAYIAVQGAISLIAGLRANKDNPVQNNRPAITLGIGMLVAALLVLFMAKPLLASLPFILGLILIFTGISRVANGFTRKEYVNVTPWPMVVYGALLILLGVVLVINPFGSLMMLFRFFGGTMIAMVIMDFFAGRYYKDR
ncbi:DUF308 domain-containing protein [Schleiferilactobacillus perolens]|uniref:Acid-resistance membrane protein n=1 Tax=Schleiferilactobacillus perolens DSM 12744 TaxID=1423792 RepID=A0A0R1N6H8_9LACO|nr:DUF308 domain-containing protein [Schleiferilactobacillus perolens]KRL12547.1 hypothetical protein FD09_GL002865 [Schleiferilactobacillus perolens DSM 12744]